MNHTNDEINKFKQKIKAKEQLVYLTVTDPHTNHKINFTVKNDATIWRGRTLLTKEPITIDWIKSFKKKSVFYDIGANIGVYSLYAAISSKVRVYAFEPESNNFQTLMENIIINHQQDNILAFPLGISNQTELTKLHLSEFASASSHHTVGESALNHGSLEKINTKYRQGIFSTTLDDLHEKWNLPLPDYIKIDVDGIEHKIIEGCNKILKNKKLSSLLIEINENRKEDQSIIKKLKKFNFNFDKEQVDKSKRKNGPHKGYAEYLFYR